MKIILPFNNLPFSFYCKIKEKGIKGVWNG
jgi:hypothetical protein